MLGSLSLSLSLSLSFSLILSLILSHILYSPPPSPSIPLPLKQTGKSIKSLEQLKQDGFYVATGPERLIVVDYRDAIAHYEATANAMTRSLERAMDFSPAAMSRSLEKTVHFSSRPSL